MAARRDVAWLDMPDIDSVEARNKSLVLSWLPYVDWLIYVVSPERYRDDVGWRLLEELPREDLSRLGDAAWAWRRERAGASS